MAETFTLTHVSSKTRAQLWDWLTANAAQILTRKIPIEHITVTPDPAAWTLMVKGDFITAEIEAQEGKIICRYTLPLLFIPFKNDVTSAFQAVLKNI